MTTGMDYGNWSGKDPDVRRSAEAYLASLWADVYAAQDTRTTDLLRKVAWSGRMCGNGDLLPPRRVSRLRRLRWWLAAHRPTAHLGPCNHEDCE